MTAIPWADRYSARTQYPKDDVIKEILKLTQQPEMISFAGGIPAQEFFPRERIREAIEAVMSDGLSAQALQYGTTEGYQPLREFLAARTRASGIPCTADNILITSGSQQALDLIGKGFINRNDAVIVEDPTYLGMLDAWRIYGARYAAIESDEYGTDPYALENALVAEPAKLIYTVPNFQNPTGVTTNPARRAEIVRLARQYNVMVIEDDPYGELRYEGESPEHLMAMDIAGVEAASNGHDPLADGNVIYLGTFSKTLCPGFRTAWITAPADVIRHLAVPKLNGDLHTSTFAQMVVYEAAKDGFLDAHIQLLRREYKERRDLMLALADELFPPNVTWTRPEGGLFLWVRMPEHVDSTVLLKHAADAHQVAYVPGRSFYAHGGGHNTFRLNFSYADPARIEEGMKRLAGVVRHSCEVH